MSLDEQSRIHGFVVAIDFAAELAGDEIEHAESAVVLKPFLYLDLLQVEREERDQDEQDCQRRTVEPEGEIARAAHWFHGDSRLMLGT